MQNILHNLEDERLLFPFIVLPISAFGLLCSCIMLGIHPMDSSGEWKSEFVVSVCPIYLIIVGLVADHFKIILDDFCKMVFK